MRKTVLFEKFPKLTAFSLPVQSIFKIFEKWFDICVQCLNAHLFNRHKAIIKKKKINFTAGDSKLWSQNILEI